eukprot:6150543-Prymnesium_polylepis.2
MPGSYLSCGWNCFDGLVVLISVGSALGGNSAVVRVLRMMRVLRPARLIARFGGMRLAMELLLRTLPEVLDVLAIYLCFLDVFAILGVQLFAGKLGSCKHFQAQFSLNPLDLFSPTELEVRKSRASCETAGGTWENPQFGSFDNIFSSALLLFEISTLEGWPSVVYAGIDATGVDLAHVRDAHPSQSIFFVLWVGLGSMTLLNLFVGVLVSAFQELRAQEEGYYLLSGAQKQWVEMMKMMMSVRPVRRILEPQEPWRAACYSLAKQPQFETCVLCIIVLNTLSMSLDSFDPANPEADSPTLDYINNACTGVFVFEAFIKISAFSFGEYIREHWHKFDFVIVVSAVLAWVVEVLIAESGSQPTLLGALRMIRRELWTFDLRNARRADVCPGHCYVLPYARPSLQCCASCAPSASSSRSAACACC